jgi:uncharacterized protein (DUF433 family)
MLTSNKKIVATYTHAMNQLHYLYYMIQWQNYIAIDPEIRFGKPIVKGTRIAVGDILGWLASGMTHEEIIGDYPPIQEEHIRAALAFAADRESNMKIIAA